VRPVRGIDPFGNVSGWRGIAALTTAAPGAAPSAPSRWIDLNDDGLADEITDAGSTWFAHSIKEESSETVTYTQWVKDWSYIPDYTYTAGRYSDVDGKTYYVPGQWVPEWSVEDDVVYLPVVRPEFSFVADPGYDYRVGRLTRRTNGVYIFGEIFSLDHGHTIEGINTWTPSDFWSETRYYVLPFVLVRTSSTPAGSILTLPGIGEITANKSAGTVKLGDGTTITAGAAGATIKFPSVGTITIGTDGTVHGAALPSGVTHVPGVPSIGLPGGITINPGAGEVTIAGPAGSSVTVDGSGGLRVALPPGVTSLVGIIGKAVDTVGNILGGGTDPNKTKVDNGDGVWRDLDSGKLGNVVGTGSQTVRVGATDSDTREPKPQNIFTITFSRTQLPVPRLAVDANRDGTITFDAADGTSVSSPYRFWLNDDIDREVTYTNVEQATNLGANEHVVGFIGSHISSFGVYETEEDDVSTTRAQSSGWKVRDWENNRLYAKRDLEDLARLWISTPGLVAALHPKDQTDQAPADLYLGLQWADVTGSPAIKVYPHVETDGGTKYLSNPTVAGNQVTFDYTMMDYRSTATPDIATMNVVAGSDMFVIPPRHFRYTSDSQPNTYFLFEGVSAGKGRLKLVILRKDGANYTPIGDGGSVWLDLKQPHEFIERWTIGDDALGAVQPVVRADSKSGTFAPPATDEEKDYVLYVHGYNMLEFEKQRWIETAYKRLWHLGYKGRVGGFTWPCSQTAPPYDESEERAWQSAQQLKNLLSSLKTAGYRVHMIAHSQGNVVAGEALRLAGANSGVVRTYVASQAAIQADSYNTNNLQIQDWGSSDSGTPNIYLSYPGAGGPYLGTSIMQGAATKFANFYNLSDYALTGNSIAFPVHPGWEADQRLKPNGSLWIFSYSFAYTSGIGFQRFQNGGWQTLQLPDDRYQIFSYAAEGRSKALGTQPTGGVFTSFTNLQSLGYADEHIWHSGQFRGSQAGRYQYWIKFLDAALIPHLNP
jgi:hypothetical protein